MSCTLISSHRQSLSNNNSLRLLIIDVGLLIKYNALKKRYIETSIYVESIVQLTSCDTAHNWQCQSIYESHVPE